MLANVQNLRYFPGMEDYDIEELRRLWRRYRKRKGRGILKHASERLDCSRQHLSKFANGDNLGGNLQEELRQLMAEDGWTLESFRAEESRASYGRTEKHLTDPVDDIVAVMNGMISAVQSRRFSTEKRLDLVEANLEVLLEMVQEARESTEENGSTKKAS